MVHFESGDIVVFSYPAVHQQGTQAHDPFPQVLVLHPNWQNNVHGLNLNYLTDNEINALRMIVDPGFELKYAENLQKRDPHLIQEIDRIVSQSAGANITSPLDFYRRVIQPFIRSRQWEPYRRYRVDKMTNIKIIQRRSIFTGEEKAGIFGTTNVRDHGKSEKEIIKNLAQKAAKKDQSFGVIQYGDDRLTPGENKFISRLRGDALKLFNDYVKKFQHSRGPKLNIFGF